MIKKYFISILLLFFIYAFSYPEGLSLVKSSSYLIYFQSNNIQDHLVGIELINKNIAEHKNDTEVINMLLNEAKYGPTGNTLKIATPEEYTKLKVYAIKTIALISDTEVAKFLLRILTDEESMAVKEACLYALGVIGDDDQYSITKSINDYYSKMNLETVKEQSSFCKASIDCIYRLSENKPLEMIEYMGVINLFKIFMNKAVFPDPIYDYSKRKLLDLMIRNS
jgi:hypothetical protein